MASADPIDDDVDDALRQDSSRRDRASPDPAGAKQKKSGRYPPAARSVDESVRKNATNGTRSGVETGIDQSGGMTSRGIIRDGCNSSGDAWSTAPHREK